MKFAVCSDEPYAINDFVIKELLRRGHQVQRFGALLSGTEESYVQVAKAAALAIINHECDEGIFFCYTATGITIAANKVPGIRAALCNDSETAKSARIYNHANVLALSNRTLSQEVAKEILSAWLDTPHDKRGLAYVGDLNALDEEFRAKTSSC